MDAAAASRCRAAGCSSITLHDSVMLLHHAARQRDAAAACCTTA